MLADMIAGGVMGAVATAVAVPVFVRPAVEMWRDRRQLWIRCDTVREADLLADRVFGYTTLVPMTKTEVDPHNKVSVYVRVPKAMLVAESMEASIRKLKEPLSV